MKIEGPIKPVSNHPTGENQPRTQPGNKQTTGAEESRVELSSTGRAEAAMASTPVVDQARVDEIRQAISEGRFQVDANRIADGLLDSVREMLDADSEKS